MTEGKIPARLRWLALLCAIMFAALTTRLWFMQLLASEQYRAKARQNGIRFVQERGERPCDPRAAFAKERDLFDVVADAVVHRRCHRADVRVGIVDVAAP